MKKTIVLLSIILLGIIGYCINQYRNSQIKDSLYSVEKKAFENAISAYQNKIDSVTIHSKRLVTSNDSIIQLISDIEAKRKKDYYIYQKKLNELSKINTYTLRQSFADSLERAMR